MKRLLVLMLMAVTIGLIFTPFKGIVIAQDSGLDKACQEAPDSPYCQSKNTVQRDNSLAKTVGKISIFVAGIGAAIAIIVIIYGGFRYVVSNGEEQKIITARNTILYGVVGLVVIIAAQSLVIFLVNFLTG